MDNPFCQEGENNEKYCTTSQSNFSYSTPPNNCVPSSCGSDQISSPNCICAYPYMGNLFFRAPSFSNLGNSSHYIALENRLMQSFQSQQFPVNSVSLSNPMKDSNDYLQVSLEVFPDGQDRFNRTGISMIGFALSNQTFKPPSYFGPFFFIARQYQHFEGKSHIHLKLIEICFSLSHCDASLSLSSSRDITISGIKEVIKYRHYRRSSSWWFIAYAITALCRGVCFSSKEEGTKSY